MRNRKKLLLAYFWGLRQGGVGMALVSTATSAVIWSSRVVQAPERMGQEGGERGGGPLAQGGPWEEKGEIRQEGTHLGSSSGPASGAQSR